jgi:hypothetical protein
MERSMRTTGKRRCVAGIGLLVAASLLTACSQATPHAGATTVDMASASTDTLVDLYRGSSAILEAELVSGPVFTATDGTADQYPGSGGPATMPLATKYAVYEVSVRSVVQKRPGVALTPAAATVRVGFNVINPDLDTTTVGNAGELKNSGFPQTSDLPSLKSTVVLFVVPTTLGALGDGYEAMSYGSRSGDSISIHFSPGKLKGTTMPFAELQSSAATTEYARAKAR